MNYEEKCVMREGLRDLADRAAANLIARGTEHIDLRDRVAVRAAVLAEMNRIAKAENAAA